MGDSRPDDSLEISIDRIPRFALLRRGTLRGAEQGADFSGFDVGQDRLRHRVIGEVLGNEVHNRMARGSERLRVHVVRSLRRLCVRFFRHVRIIEIASSMPPVAPPADFRARLVEAGIVLADGQHALLARYVQLLLEANERFNLTAVREPAQVWIRHILDSLVLTPVIASLHPTTLADVGSGGGLPGIPLAIALPEVRVTLIESIAKKSAFLRECTRALALPNVQVRSERAEAVASAHAGFDLVTARALAPLDRLLPVCAPLVHPGGHLLAVKGAKGVVELAAAGALVQELGLSSPRVFTTMTDSTLLLFEKSKNKQRRP